MTTPGTHKLPDYLVHSPHSGTDSTGDSPPGNERYIIRAGHSWDDSWELALDLHLEVNKSETKVVAVTCLDIQEYGMGDSLESAIADMLTSLSDYYQSLESREAKLAPSATKDLDTLKGLLRACGLADNARGR